MSKLKITLFSLLILAVIIIVLINNKMNMAAKTEVETITNIPVVVTSPSKQRLSNSFSLVGTTLANYDVAVAAETQGKVKEVYARVGDRIQAGNPIVRVDDELKRAGFETAEVSYTKAKRDVERFELLHKDSSVSDSQIEAARLAFKSAEAQYITARRQFNDTKITSPISGIVTSRTVDIGSNVQMNMIIANVVDISKLKVKVNISEKDVFHIKTADSVHITTDVYPGITFGGTITNISSKGDESHTYPVEISLPNSTNHPLKAGMFARVNFTSGTEHESLVIPREALTGSLKQPQVFVIENNIARLRQIVIGRESETFLEVLSGLTGNEILATEGKNNLKDGYLVNITKTLSENMK